MPPERYEFLDEEHDVGYNQPILKAVLIDAIRNTYNIETLSKVAAQVFLYEGKIVRPNDDDGVLVAYPKDHDVIGKHLATMAVRQLQKGGTIE